MAVAQTPLDDRSRADEGETARLVLSGELDLATVPRVQQAVDATLAEGARTLVVDLSGLGFIDSSGLRLFIVLHQRAGAEGWRLSLIRPQKQAMTVFEVSGLEENLPFSESARPAMTARSREEACTDPSVRTPLVELQLERTVNAPALARAAVAAQRAARARRLAVAVADPAGLRGRQQRRAPFGGIPTRRSSWSRASAPRPFASP